MPSGRATFYNSDFVTKAQEYLENCIKKDDIPYFEELARTLGVHRETLIEWEKIHEDLAFVMKQIETEQRFKLMKKSITGRYNPAASIFQLKVNHGMKETQVIENTGQNGQPIQINVYGLSDPLYGHLTKSAALSPHIADIPGPTEISGNQLAPESAKDDNRDTTTR